MTTTLTNSLLLITALLLSACSSLPIQHSGKMTNLYQHRWINSGEPHTTQDINSVARYLADYDVVFFGELHEHPAVHLAQMQLFEAMYRLNPQLSLSLEQFERDTQVTVDEYLAGKIGEKHMIKKARAWNNYPTSYRPLVEFAKQQQLPVVAANAPKNTVVCVGRLGLYMLDTLSPEERQYIAKDIHNFKGAYREKFMSFLTNNASHGTISNDKMSKMMQQMSERSFAAQRVRDDTMAESIALHRQTNLQRQILHLTGLFHSSKFLGTVERLSHRLPELKIAVIETVTVTENDDRWKTDKLNNANLLLLVPELPTSFIQQNNKQEWSRAILKIRKKSGVNCGTEQQPSSNI